VSKRQSCNFCHDTKTGFKLLVGGVTFYRTDVPLKIYIYRENFLPIFLGVADLCECHFVVRHPNITSDLQNIVALIYPFCLGN